MFNVLSNKLNSTLHAEKTFRRDQNSFQGDGVFAFATEAKIFLACLVHQEKEFIVFVFGFAQSIFINGFVIDGIHTCDAANGTVGGNWLR